MRVAAGGLRPSAGIAVHDQSGEHVGVLVGMSSVDDLESVDVQVQDAFLETGDMEAERVGCDHESALFTDDVYCLLHR